MKTLTQMVLAAALVAMTALSAASRAEEAARGLTPKADLPKLEAPKADSAKTEPQKMAPAACTPNWTAKKYKPFDKVQNEVKKRYGDVRILRVALCGEGAGAYFQIVIISGKGSVSRVQIAASN